jgi:hypothetical protein
LSPAAHGDVIMASAGFHHNSRACPIEGHEADLTL